MSDQRVTGEGLPRARGRRAVARRNRTAVIAATAKLLQDHAPLTMQAVAAAADVSRSTLYRHFANPAELQRALQRETLARAESAIRDSVRGRRPALAELRSVVSALVTLGAELPLDVPIGSPSEEALADTGNALGRVAERLAQAADLDPAPAGPWLASGIAHFLETCLRAGWTGPDDGRSTVEHLFGTITDPLDQGLLLLDAMGAVVASNPGGRVALEDSEPGRRAVVDDGGLYEDRSPASPEGHPVTTALAGGESQHGIRGHHTSNGRLCWFSIDVRCLRRSPSAQPYGFVAVFTDVSQEKRFELAKLRPPGALGATSVPILDIVRVLDEVPPPLLPEQLIAEAMRIARGPVALYVLDIDGSHLLRLAGTEEFPSRLKAPLALGPELAEDGLPDLTAHLARELPGVVMAPMWLRGRAVGVLLARRGSEAGLRDVARLGAAAMELAGGYSDVFDAARRRKDMTPAAEIQQSLLPPRIVRMGSGELAGSVIPAYEVGGDWFDYVENRDGAWIAIADGAGRGPRAAALSSVALAALRAARRNDATLEEAAHTMDETVAAAGGPEFFVTAVIARWHPAYSLFSWINLGHPPPLLIRADDMPEELATQPDLPLGLTDRARSFRRHQRRLLVGDRLVLYTDGISRRRTPDGPFDVGGIANAVRGATRRSATAAARAIQEAVVSASEDPLPDDAAVVVLAAGPGRLLGGRGSTSRSY
jgi:AcrR family transcriptional regulator